jgi:phosphohistidine phosphatase
MRTAYLLRHAKSDWSDRTLADHDRPLARRGRRDAERVAKHLRGLGLEPELVLCSSAERTRGTLELIRPALGGSRVLIEKRLYAASSDELLERLRAVPEPVASVMLIGHNPGIQELALALAAAGAERELLAAKFPTGALATFAVLVATWSRLAAGDAELTAFVAPKQLR